MIAAMRPSHAYQHTSSPHSRPDSRNSTHSNVSMSNTPSHSRSDKLVAKAASNAASLNNGKKSSSSKKAASASQPVSDAQISRASPTPGLISLTKPLAEEMQPSKSSSSTKSKKGKETKFQNTDSPAGTPIKNGRSKKSKISPRSHPSENLLSKSAPSAPIQHGNGADASSTEANSGLTWQQEMFNLSSKSQLDLTHQGKKQGRKANQNSSSKHDGNLAHPQKVQPGSDSSALTWQQELLGAKKRTGPHFDVFADARDAETFGDDSRGNHSNASSKGGKRGKGQGKARNGDVALQIDDLFDSNGHSHANKSGSAHIASKQYPPHGAPIHIAPSTPAKKVPNLQQQQQHPAVAAAIAYAGPNFHNSPSPASLPAPKFQNRLGKNGHELERPSSLVSSSSGNDSGSSDGEYELTRGVRSTTAPAEVSTPSKSYAASAPPKDAAAPAPPAQKAPIQPGATVESLLARMLGGSKLN